ncbi:class I SAM-dependent methyltransferase [Sulfurimonas sp.]|uniref:class I SAM-dependent methyltransferase n=1 Tax=Sulfurimonas sp. TaxID=2022749 RepID=UPI00356A7FFA
MGKLLDIVTKLHTRTSRDYVSRMVDDKINAMVKSKEYGYDYWDGDRKYGYGGYKYDGRWKVVAEDLIREYDLKDGCKILDVGCGKAFLLYELKQLLPNSTVVGIDSSEYALENAKEEIKDSLTLHKAEDSYPFKDNEFDLLISLTTLHNLKIYDLKKAVQECQRVAKNKYIMVEAYRNEAELFNLECWALTCESFFRPDEWVWMYNEWGYDGDYEFIYFE